MVADLDPLGIIKNPIHNQLGLQRRANELVTRKYFEFDESDMEKEFTLPPTTVIGGKNKQMKLR